MVVFWRVVIWRVVICRFEVVWVVMGFWWDCCVMDYGLGGERGVEFG